MTPKRSPCGVADAADHILPTLRIVGSLGKREVLANGPFLNGFEPMLVFPSGMNVGVRVEDARLDAPLAEKPHRLHGARAAARVKQQLHLVLVCMFHARYTTISRLERDDVHGNCESVASRRVLNLAEACKAPAPRRRRAGAFRRPARGRRRIEVRGLCASLFCEQGELS